MRIEFAIDNYALDPAALKKFKGVEGGMSVGDEILDVGVEYQLTRSALILPEKEARIPADEIASIDVYAFKKGLISPLGVIFGAIALLFISQGWLIASLIAGALAFAGFKWRSKLAVFKAHVWTNGYEDLSNYFKVSNSELPRFERALKEFPEIRLNIKGEYDPDN